VSTVLIADDDADHRVLLALALQWAGHDVVTAEDASGAMAALAAGGIDAALLDVRMPGGDGIELCRRLRAEPATAPLPVMLISADVNDQRILAALLAGADDYLTKPFHRAELRARLDTMLRRPSAEQATRSAAAASVAGRAATQAVRSAARHAPEPRHRDTA